MGRYRKKAYKKKQIDPWHEWDLNGEIQYELDLFHHEPDLSEPFSMEDDEFMEPLIDEPDIVKELRALESSGELSFISPLEKKEECLPEFQEYKETSLPSLKKQNMITSYDDAYKIAKKVFDKI